MEVYKIKTSVAMFIIAVIGLMINDVCCKSIDKHSDNKLNNRYIRSFSDLPNENMEAIKTPVIFDASSFPDKFLDILIPKNRQTGGAIAAMLPNAMEKRFQKLKHSDPIDSLVKLIKNISQQIKNHGRVLKSNTGVDDAVRISTIVKTWEKNGSTNEPDQFISGYKTEVDNPKRAGRLSINGALTSLADLLVSENQRRDRTETMELRQRLQFLG